LGTAKASLSKFVAAAVKVLVKEKGIRYEMTSMGTNIECSSLARLLRIAAKMHRAAFCKGAGRVLTTVKIDDRKDKHMTIQGKIDSVRKKLRGG
jgi:uncharacterized protein (TIGR00106 family)